jgi:hypothetical protein
MANPPLTPLEIYRLLEKSNCGRCHLPSCLAFAAAVVAGRSKLIDCPHLAREAREQLAGKLKTRAELMPDQAEFIDRLEDKVAGLDLSRIAPVIGGVYQDNRLIISSMGKDFQVDQQGQLYSECHIIPWVKAPLLSYITHATHQNITGTWVSFRELDGGMEWQNLFTSRCERVLKDLADANPELLSDIVDLFMGVPTKGFQADIALILHPLPHIPLLICYQAPDEDLESELTIFFDACCGDNLHIKSIFTLCSGLVQMFDRIAKIHS